MHLYDFDTIQLKTVDICIIEFVGQSATFLNFSIMISVGILANFLNWETKQKHQLKKKILLYLRCKQFFIFFATLPSQSQLSLLSQVLSVGYMNQRRITPDRSHG